MVYLGACRFLDVGHRFRNATTAFNGRPKRDGTPLHQSGQEVYNNGMEREEYLYAGGVEDSEEDLVRKHDVKRVNIFYRLPYWEVSMFAIIKDAFLKL